MLLMRACMCLCVCCDRHSESNYAGGLREQENERAKERVTASERGIERERIRDVNTGVD